jgi:guanosine-3',5'-bis(diphosphate) 3'-pyrophosphohydrolase
MNAKEFAQKAIEANPRLAADLLARAHDFAVRAHAGQKRKSGDPFVSHAEEVALILGGLRLDSATVAAGLLHDVIEEGGVQLPALRAEFGDEIAELVDGVTKITGLRFESMEREQAENFRKMLLSVVKDVRILLIKLADRLHNMRTISHLSPGQIERISRETREIYAPLAGRFGMALIQRELEDLSFQWLEPEEHRKLVELVSATREKRDAYTEEVARPIREKLESEGIRASISGRVKHLQSIHRKMVVRKRRFEEIFDLVAIRIVCDDEGTCYRVLGIVHALFNPVPSGLKDYIAKPKTNGYRSLHTTVIGPRGEKVEIQIRTREMHEQAEVGIAAHWEYKEGKPGGEELRQRLASVRQFLEDSVDVAEAGEFLESLKLDLYRDEIFVFTPKGDLKHLPKGATPLDFAYAIHTDVGEHCVGARVNGRLVPLKHELESGDVVEIMTMDTARPSRDWLSLVVTSRAKGKIRRHLREQADGQSVVLGRRIIDRELKKLGRELTDVSLDDIAQGFGLDGAQELSAAVGRGDVGVGELGRRLRPTVSPGRGIVERLARRVRRHDAGVRIEGIGDIMVRFAQCCQPVPGDHIVGIITRGRGISVHRIDCPNAFGPSVDGEHRIAVEWDVQEDLTYPVGFVVRGELTPSFLADVSRAIADEGVDVTGASMTTEDGQVVARFVVTVGNLHRLKKLMRTIESLKGVRHVERRRSVKER